MFEKLLLAVIRFMVVGRSFPAIFEHCENSHIILWGPLSPPWNTENPQKGLSVFYSAIPKEITELYRTCLLYYVAFCQIRVISFPFSTFAHRKTPHRIIYSVRCWFSWLPIGCYSYDFKSSLWVTALVVSTFCLTKAAIIMRYGSGR